MTTINKLGTAAIKETKNFVISATFIAAAALSPLTADAEGSLPLDDPWIVFCLTTQPVEEVGDCIDGLPSVSRDIFKNTDYEVKYDVQLKVVKRKPEAFDSAKYGTNSRFESDTFFGRMPHGEARSTIVCPHEFGAACHLLEDAVYAFGGSCKDGRNNTICELPD